MAEKVYGNPVWPLEDQPVGSSIDSEQRIANAKFVAWNFYQEGFTIQSCYGIVSAIAHESGLDPCAREDGGPGLGWMQRSYTNIPRDFEAVGYHVPEDWLNITANCYAQAAYYLYRLTSWGSWSRPAQREFDEETQSWHTVGHPSINPSYELSQADLKASTNPSNVAASIAVMMEHPYGVNDVYGYYGNPVGDAAALQTAVNGYQRYVSRAQTWFTEQDIQNYVPPSIINPSPFPPTFSSKTFFYIRPWWQRIGR